MVRNKRPRRRAARDRLHHRRLDFQKVARFEKTPQQPDNSRTLLENLAHFGIDY